MAREFRNGINVDTGSVSPSSQSEGDAWYRSDLHRMWFRNEAANMEIPGHITTIVSSAINATTAKTSIAVCALTVGWWHIDFWSMCSTSSGNMTTTVDFSGTATGNYQVQNESATAITGAFNNTSFGSALLGSSTSPLFRKVKGLINVTVAGNLTVSHTAVTSFTVPAASGILDCARVF